MKLKLPYIALLLIFLVLIIYYPMIFAGFNSVDDLDMVNWLFNAEYLNIKKLFLPGESGYYYRPLLGLTFMADKQLWGLLPSFMHLENILFHAINVLLVFIIAIKIFKKYGLDHYVLPFISALIFAVHPINTEAVNWISGRTDVLSCTFTLGALFFVLLALEKDDLYCAIASMLLFLGCLVKEVVVFFYPAVLLIIYCYDRGIDYSLFKHLKTRLIYYAFVIASLAAYFLLRHLAFMKSDSGIATAVKGITSVDTNIADSIRIFLKVMGFYLKKIFMPWPLNFGIIEVSDYYVFLGVLLIIIFLYLLYRRDLIAAVYIAGICTILPAFLVAIGGMAWTRIAERYVYISSATFAIGITYTIYCFFKTLQHLIIKGTGSIEAARGTHETPLFFSTSLQMPVKQRFYWLITYCSLVLGLIVVTITTVQRNIIWQDNLTLFQDTVEKSPNFPPAKNQLAAALLQHGRTSEAFEMVRSNTLPSQENDYLIAHINMAKVMAAEGDIEGGRKLLLANLDESSKNYIENLRALIAINEKRFELARQQAKKNEIGYELIDHLLRLYKRTSDPYYCYRIGQFYLFVNNKEEARRYFAMAYETSPKNAYYRLPAKKIAEKLVP